jgi:hypothetical protein
MDGLPSKAEWNGGSAIEASHFVRFLEVLGPTEVDGTTVHLKAGVTQQGNDAAELHLTPGISGYNLDEIGAALRALIKDEFARSRDEFAAVLSAEAASLHQKIEALRVENQRMITMLHLQRPTKRRYWWTWWRRDEDE